MFLYHHVNSACQNSKNFFEKVVPCFFFHNKLFETSPVSYIFTLHEKKKVNAMGKISARAYDKPGYF